MRLVVFVEGHGDVEAVPTLIRGYFPAVELIKKPIRVRRDRFLSNTDEQRRYLELARVYLGKSGAVLVLLDADDDCPAQVAPKILGSLRKIDLKLQVSFIMAKCEFETWFLACADRLSIGEVPPNLEDIRGAKEEIKNRLGRYAETIDQPRLTAKLVKECDPLVLRRLSPSFDKFWRELERIVKH